MRIDVNNIFNSDLNLILRYLTLDCRLWYLGTFEHSLRLASGMWYYWGLFSGETSDNQETKVSICSL